MRKAMIIVITLIAFALNTITNIKKDSEALAAPQRE
jgi:hypothetical protein